MGVLRGRTLVGEVLQCRSNTGGTVPFDERGGDGTDHIRIGTEGTILASHVEPVTDINVGDDAEVDINTEIAELSCEGLR